MILKKYSKNMHFLCNTIQATKTIWMRIAKITNSIIDSWGWGIMPFYRLLYFRRWTKISRLVSLLLWKFNFVKKRDEIARSSGCTARENTTTTTKSSQCECTRRWRCIRIYPIYILRPMNVHWIMNAYYRFHVTWPAQ